MSTNNSTTNILVTGSNRGIGLALCKQLFSRGDHVRVFAACRTASDELANLGVDVIAGIDMSHDDAPDRLADALGQALGKSGSLDWVINNAGIMRRTSLDNLNPEAIEEQFRVNALAPLRVTQALLSYLKAGSKVGFITSRMGSIADNTSGGAYGYRASKTALNSFAASLAFDLKPQDIAVAILHPGWVKTAMTGSTGNLTAAESAAKLLERMDELNMQNTGTFWHCSGEVLPW